MLAVIFVYIYLRFRYLANGFGSIADWLYDQGWPWRYLSPPFQYLHDLCLTIADYFYDAYIATHNLEALLDDAWSKAKQVFNYVYDVLRARVNDALDIAWRAFDYAITAYNKARDAWNYATGWLTDRANEAWSRAGNVWGSVTDWLKDKATDAYNKAVWAYEQIQAVVTAATQEIYAWVKSIPAEIKDYVAGVVTAIGAVTIDIVQTLIKAALAAIAGPINLVNLWFDDIQDFFNSPLDWLESKFGDWFFGPEK